MLKTENPCVSCSRKYFWVFLQTKGLLCRAAPEIHVCDCVSVRDPSVRPWHLKWSRLSIMLSSFRNCFYVQLHLLTFQLHVIETSSLFDIVCNTRVDWLDSFVHIIAVFFSPQKPYTRPVTGPKSTPKRARDRFFKNFCDFWTFQLKPLAREKSCRKNVWARF